MPISVSCAGYDGAEAENDGIDAVFSEPLPLAQADTEKWDFKEQISDSTGIAECAAAVAHRSADAMHGEKEMDCCSCRLLL